MDCFMPKCIVIILWESRIDEFSLFMNFFIPFINNVKSSIKSSLFTNRLYLNRSNVFCMICPYVRTMYIQSDLCSQINFREIAKRVLAKNKLIIYSTNEHFFTKSCIFFILSIPNIKLVRCYDASRLVFVTEKKNKIFDWIFIVWK